VKTMTQFPMRYAPQAYHGKILYHPSNEVFIAPHTFVNCDTKSYPKPKKITFNQEFSLGFFSEARESGSTHLLMSLAECTISDS